MKIVNCLSETFDSVNCKKAKEIGKGWYEVNVGFKGNQYKFFYKEYKEFASLARGDWMVETTIPKGAQKLKTAIENAIFRNKWGD